MRPGSSLLECYRQKIECMGLPHGPLLPPLSPVLANIYSIVTYDVPDTEDVGLPTKFLFNVGPPLQPIAGSMPVNHRRR